VQPASRSNNKQLGQTFTFLSSTSGRSAKRNQLQLNPDTAASETGLNNCVSGRGKHVGTCVLVCGFYISVNTRIQRFIYSSAALLAIHTMLLLASLSQSAHNNIWKAVRMSDPVLSLQTSHGQVQWASECKVTARAQFCFWLSTFLFVSILNTCT
jgi:hypothetical protein